MLHHCFLIIGALLSLAISGLIAMETCPATGMPGMPGECIFVHMIVETDVFLCSIGFLSFIRTF